MASSGTHAYVADGFAGLQVVDITNPADPQPVGSWGRPEVARGVAISGPYAYLAGGVDGLVVLPLQCEQGTPIYLAEDDWLTTVLSRKQPAQTGSAVIGSLLTRPPSAVPVVLDVKELVSTHLAIIASTGTDARPPRASSIANSP